MKHFKKIGFAMLITMVVMSTGCKKDYYKDTGLHTAEFNGSVYDYLQSKPEYFDTVLQVIKLAGMEDVFKSEDITFFAPADSSINRSIQFFNLIQGSQGRQLITRLDQVKPEVWKHQLSLYLFKGKKSMNDYRQIDPQNLSAYPGQIYASYDGSLMNIGVIYNDAGGVKYVGYRQLMISYIPSKSAPRDYASWFSAIVASVNVAPKNGYVHVLVYPGHYFGFEPSQFMEDVLEKGLNP